MLFLEDENGNIHWLDVGSATLSQIAVSRAQFDEMRQQVEYADRWFAPQLVGELMTSGITLEKNQCFSYKIPLTLGGTFDETNFDVCDVSIHFRTHGQIQKQVNDFPVGSKITSVEVES